ncbi:MAG TPA: glycosyl hydrolase 108 family protein [Hymenobacter sp.]|uniref:glycoside hydrolase family 108 protein n=1 Tax=Hymenobacter sp. TaxID=1898978 RepID=UPI002D7E3F38|nr:glycosyl hydrolase 108 family protein [Hymenobacter sp.]HET9504175.1 glycosyl hydrolase 108 family protein [Hymenobacter sp.]
MASFDAFYPRLLRAEGGYCHLPGDSGGETWCGIARAYYPGWPGWPLVDAAKRRLGAASPVLAGRWPGLSRELATDARLAEQARAFYRRAFWDALRLTELSSQAVAEQLADHGVNAGVARAPRLLQYALRQLGQSALAEDGLMGPHTLRAANAAPAPALHQALVQLRRQFYRFRAGALVLAAPDPLAGLFARLRLHPDASQARFLAGWLARIEALPACAGAPQA